MRRRTLDLLIHYRATGLKQPETQRRESRGSSLPPRGSQHGDAVGRAHVHLTGRVAALRRRNLFVMLPITALDIG